MIGDTTADESLLGGDTSTGVATFLHDRLHIITGCLPKPVRPLIHSVHKGGRDVIHHHPRYTSFVCAAAFVLGVSVTGDATAVAMSDRPGIIQPQLTDMAAQAAATGQPVKVLIAYDRPPDVAERDQIAALGGNVSYVFSIVPVIAAEIDPAALDAVAALPDVSLIEWDGEFQAFDQELDNTWGVKHLGAGYAHDFGYTGNGVKVAVLDTGIDYNHPELAGRVKGGWDFVNNDPDPMDDHDHGTHVAGTIAAAWDGVGVVGMAPDVELYALKVLNSKGSGNFSTVIAALQWSVDNGINVTNQSLGSFFNPGQSVENAYNAAYQAGILHVAASGNFYGLFGISYPARYESVVAVGAIDRNNKVAGFTDTGPQMELTAPGVDVPSCKRGGGYIVFSGTSMASPHAAGAAALVFASDVVDENHDGKINDDVRNRLAQTAVDRGAEGRDSKYGFGIVNAQAAVKRPMVMDADPLVRGSSAWLYVSGATPMADVYFYYATSGYSGPTPIDSFGVLLAIGSPKLAQMGTADGSGNASISVNVPSNAPRINIWLQAAETGNTSQVLKATIQ